MARLVAADIQSKGGLETTFASEGFFNMAKSLEKLCNSMETGNKGKNHPNLCQTTYFIKSILVRIVHRLYRGYLLE
jgi:hypothetical protein